MFQSTIKKKILNNLFQK